MHRIQGSWHHVVGFVVVSGLLVQSPSSANGPAMKSVAADRSKAASSPIGTTGLPNELTRLVSSASHAPVRPLTDQDIQQGRHRVKAAADGLDQFLNRGAASNAEAWKRFLKWDELERQLTTEGLPDVGRLSQVLAQFYDGHPGLQLPPFVELREAILRLQRQILARQSDDFPQLVRDQLTAIQSSLDEGTTELGASLVDLGARLEWLEHLGQAADTVSGIRQQFGHPNLIVVVTADALRRGFVEDVDEQTAVNEWILGTRVRGTARTRGTLTPHLIPNDDRAIIELTMNGTSTSNTIGRQSPVRIYSQGVTQAFARKRLCVDSFELRSDPAIASCSTDNHICRIRSESAFASHLIEKIAWKRARQQERRAEAIASRRAEYHLAKRMDQLAGERLAKSNQQLESKIRGPLKRRGVFPRILRFSTTADQIQMTALQGHHRQLAAASDPPVIESHQILAQMHESLLINSAINGIGGLTVSDELAQKLIHDVTGDVPEELQIKQDEDPWAITFDMQHPVRVEFDDNHVVIGIRCRRFSRGDQELRQTTEISATYRLGIQDGRALLSRVGDIEVIYPDKDSERLSLVELRNKTFLVQKFSGVFKSELGGEGLPLGERWQKLKDLTLDHISAQNGWLTVGWN